MALKNVFLTIPFEQVTRVQGSDGKWYTHILVDEKYLPELDALGITKWSDTKQHSDLPAELKNDKGQPRHVFFGREGETPRAPK